MKTVDVMIPVYKPGKQLDRMLTVLEQQTLRPEHIFIVNTERQYWNSALEKKHPLLQVTHISKPEFNHGGTRKQMALKSQADVMIFMTQDAMPQNVYLLERLVRTFEENRVAAAYARQLPAKDCRLAEAFTREFNYPCQSMKKGKEDIPRLGIKTCFCSNVCAAYDRRIYEELGGFVSSTIFNEDMIFARKLIEAGYQIAYAADACVIHSHNYTCMEQLRRNFDLGVSQVQYREAFAGLPSEKEGIRMVKKTIIFLLKSKKPWLIPETMLQSGFKYAGYLLGKHYEKLPVRVIKFCTMNKDYWK